MWWFVSVLDSPREIRQGEEIAWYPDGETIVVNENVQSIAYQYGMVRLWWSILSLE